ncbi:hypothetical protein B0J17DRAFT_666363 [Rhizoctonia solani]|nr:hypothetical protein B0J17DRAFT_666363 [Rhizoctonia solani]
MNLLMIRLAFTSTWKPGLGLKPDAYIGSTRSMCGLPLLRGKCSYEVWFDNQMGGMLTLSMEGSNSLEERNVIV